ncbi:hypothetical protein THAOC_17494 [Thalassiosira oceanica]|uniref:Uncharacterized protein n=1 Tax=Thalassiosira oceanica TaxID=159749 RepID=K0SUH5_THAOC|nr:hypothetical protein THAOC_17494 [Thalassiosira oceanica]|eukprot:EJK61927.1 hypothetical protein THAOC_17494 [Thalassiosira oceanica]
MAISDILLLSGGELSDDVAARVRARLSSLGLNVRPVSMSKSKAFKSALVEDAASATTLAIFVVSTIENEEPTEEAGACNTPVQKTAIKLVLCSIRDWRRLEPFAFTAGANATREQVSLRLNPRLINCTRNWKMKLPSDPRNAARLALNHQLWSEQPKLRMGKHLAMSRAADCVLGLVVWWRKYTTLMNSIGFDPQYQISRKWKSNGPLSLSVAVPYGHKKHRECPTCSYLKHQQWAP